MMTNALTNDMPGFQDTNEMKEKHLTFWTDRQLYGVPIAPHRHYAPALLASSSSLKCRRISVTIQLMRIILRGQ